MLVKEFLNLKKGDSFYVEDSSFPNLIRKVLFQERLDRIYTAEAGLCLYINEDNTPQMEMYGDEKKEVICYFGMENSALTQAKLKEILFEEYSNKLQYAQNSVEECKSKLSKLVDY